MMVLMFLQGSPNVLKQFNTLGFGEYGVLSTISTTTKEERLLNLDFNLRKEVEMIQLEMDYGSGSIIRQLPQCWKILENGDIGIQLMKKNAQKDGLLTDSESDLSQNKEMEMILH